MTGLHTLLFGRFALIAVLSALLWSGCASNEKSPSGFENGVAELSGTPAALTSEAARVFGFENAAADWSSVSGTSDLHTEGTVSGSVTVTGWTQVTSIRMSSIADAGVEIGQAAAFDIRLPESAPWGEARLIIDLPSQGIWWRDLGGVRLTDLTPGEFASLNFVIPQDVTAALNGAYTDLRVIVIINGPMMSSPVLLDNFQFAGVSTGGDTEAGDEISFGFDLPSAVALESVVVHSNSSLKIADAVHGANTTANIVNMGSELAELGADAEVDGNVYARSDVWLRERAAIHGVVMASGNIDTQNGVVADDGLFPYTPVNIGANMEWSVNWPSVNGVYELEPDGALDLPPGNYTSVSVKPRAELTLHAGTYYFDHFYADSEAVIHLVGNGSAIIIYVRDSFTSRAALDHSYSSEDFLLAFAGTTRVELDGPFAGTVVAPNATVRLAPLNGGSHEGSFFASRVEAEARTPINLVPFAHWDLLLNLCPGNPDKQAPGVCGCAQPDDDDDSDGFENCIELCDDDPNKQFPGITGCGNSDDADCDSDMLPDAIDPWVCEDNIHSQTCDGAPDGTICNDGLCNGVYECQDGQCGNPADCRPQCDGECVEVPLEEKTYVVCNCNVRWDEAAAYCRADKDRKLVHMNDYAENDLVTSFLDELGITDAWIGANDLTTEGKWQWQAYTKNNGKLFWVGGADGRRHYTSVVRWAEGEPDSGHCGALSADGTWHGESCETTRGFVCEAPGQYSPRRGITGHVGIPTYIEPDVCDTDYEASFPPPNGVIMGDNVGLDPATEALYTNCATAASNESDYISMGCADLPLGDVPDDNVCPAWDVETEASAADGLRETFFPITDCELTVLAPLVNVALSPTETVQLPKLCERSSDCNAANDEFCGKIGFCCPLGEDIDDTLACDFSAQCDPTACAYGDDTCHAGQCGTGAQCTAVQACGIPQDDSERACFEEISEPGQPCGQVELCTPIDEMDLDNAGNSFVNAAETPEDLVEQFPHAPDEEVGEDPDTTYDNNEFDWPCGAGTTDCTIVSNEHPWCQYNVASPASLTEGENVGSTEDSFVNSDSNSGSKTIDFDFEPVFDWDYKAHPAPLGFFRPVLSTHAGVQSSVTLAGVFGKSSSVDLIDAQLYLRLGLEPRATDYIDLSTGETTKGVCGLTTTSADGSNSKIEILGIDFLPESLQDFAFPSQELQNDCVQGYRDFETAVNKAKKAMRDAQELVRIYKDLRSEAKNFNTGVLCEKLINDLISDPFSSTELPAKFENFAANCANKTPEDTINLFIEYYQIDAIQEVKNAITQLVNATSAIQASGEIDIVGWGDEKEVTLFNQTFMVGPIPCNLEVFISLAYGFDVAAGFSFTPANMLHELLDTQTGSEASNRLSNTVASVSLIARPYAAARVGLFVGVGFDIGIAAAKVGIDGIVSIGEISVPSSATVGLAFDAIDDSRELTGSLADVTAAGGDNSSPVYLIPPRKFQLKLVYGMDIGVNITDVLSGSVGLKVKLKFLFFSKTWRQQIAKWNGLCSSAVPEEDRQSWCSFDLLHLDGELATQPIDMAWAAVKMPTPFTQIPLLTYSPATDVDGNIIEDTLIEATDEAAIDALYDRSHAFFYDVQCNPPIQIF
ncbi:MAG: hypothetical protein JXX29_06425 [Deltaproteobacteria bacterium]|nr:hypothetical protein [Deltaproteobacteria bacterium]